MKRSITRWTTTLTTAVVLGLPATALAQAPTPQPPTQEQAQPPSQQPPAAATPQPEQTEAVPPQEHLRQAKAALGSISPASVTGRARTQLSVLARHLTALERASAAPAPAPRGTTARANVTWGTEVAAMDKVLTDLLATDSTAGTGGVTGGTIGTAGTTRSKAATPVALDEATRNKLMDVRKHITAYAVSMSGAQIPPKTDAAMTSGEQPATAPAPPTTPGSPTNQASPAPPSPTLPRPQVDAEAARRHLTAARETLTQLTQAPAAAQLTGDTRTQVSQLIANFNELITTQSQWRASYAKVAANLTALLGPDATSAEPTAAVPPVTPETAAAGIVGTSGTAKADMDPAVRAKLVELRRHLTEFEKAMGG